MKTFVISLKEATERRKSICDQFTNIGLNFTFFDAIHGKDFYDNPNFFNKEKSLKYEHRVMTPGEIGCALSHLSIYKQIIDENLPYALIFEDDAIISEDLPSVLSVIEKHINPNDLITLEKCDVYSKKRQINLLNQYKIVIPRMVRFGSVAQTAGYIITKQAAKSILSINLPIFTPADSWTPYLKHINFKGVIPSCSLVHQDEKFNSTIVTGHRNTNTKNTVFKMLFYAFYTHTFLGRFLKSIYKKLIKPLIKKN